jgi:hypothetical protein
MHVVKNGKYVFTKNKKKHLHIFASRTRCYLMVMLTITRRVSLVEQELFTLLSTISVLFYFRNNECSPWKSQGIIYIYFFHVYIYLFTLCCVSCDLPLKNTCTGTKLRKWVAMYMCPTGVYFVAVSMIFRLDFGTVIIQLAGFAR